ncbi:MAG: hypothetical protein H6737_00520 [Alphaproteobacteria bacterium]|nr:hypothetical protein [Alphaproteobacteria bacterium]
MHIHEPRLHHVVGAVLCSASWFTLMMLVAIDVAGFQTPKGDTVDWLFGVPAAFRVAGWSLLLWRGTWVAALGVVVDLALVLAVFGDANGDTKGNLLLAALLLSNAIPAYWAARGGRLGALPGLVGTGLAGVAWLLTQSPGSGDLMLPLVTVAVLASWFADAAIGWWALQVWRAENLEEAREI